MDDQWVRAWIKEAVAQLPAGEPALTYDIAGVPVRISGAHQAIVVVQACRNPCGTNRERSNEEVP